MCSRCSTPGTWLLDHITARNLVPVRRLISPSGWKTHNALHHRFLPLVVIPTLQQLPSPARTLTPDLSPI